MGRRKGTRHSLETRLKMSQAHLGKRLSLSHRLAISRSQRGKKISEAQKGKLRQAAFSRWAESDNKLERKYEGNLPSAVLLSYTAGLLDGEGYFGVELHHRKNSAKHGRHWFRAVIACKIREPEVRLLKTLFGGSSKIEPKGKMFYWSFSGQQVGTLCKWLLPYLTLKKKNAENILDFLNFQKHCMESRKKRAANARNSLGQFQHSFSGYTKDEHFALLSYVIRSKELNSTMLRRRDAGFSS